MSDKHEWFCVQNLHLSPMMTLEEFFVMVFSLVANPQEVIKVEWHDHCHAGFMQPCGYHVFRLSPFKSLCVLWSSWLGCGVGMQQWGRIASAILFLPVCVVVMFNVLNQQFFMSWQRILESPSVCFITTIWGSYVRGKAYWSCSVSFLQFSIIVNFSLVHNTGCWVFNNLSSSDQNSIVLNNIIHIK